MASLQLSMMDSVKNILDGPTFEENTLKAMKSLINIINDSQDKSYEMSIPSEDLMSCSVCQNPVTRRCVRCAMPYCSSACREKDWMGIHHFICFPEKTDAKLNILSPSQMEKFHVLLNTNVMPSLHARSEVKGNDHDFSSMNSKPQMSTDSGISPEPENYASSKCKKTIKKDFSKGKGNNHLTSKPQMSTDGGTSHEPENHASSKGKKTFNNDLSDANGKNCDLGSMNITPQKPVYDGILRTPENFASPMSKKTHMPYNKYSSDANGTNRDLGAMNITPQKPVYDGILRTPENYVSPMGNKTHVPYNKYSSGVKEANRSLASMNITLQESTDGILPVPENYVSPKDKKPFNKGLPRQNGNKFKKRNSSDNGTQHFSKSTLPNNMQYNLNAKDNKSSNPDTYDNHSGQQQHKPKFNNRDKFTNDDCHAKKEDSDWPNSVGENKSGQSCRKNFPSKNTDRISVTSDATETSNNFIIPENPGNAGFAALYCKAGDVLYITLKYCKKPSSFICIASPDTMADRYTGLTDGGLDKLVINNRQSHTRVMDHTTLLAVVKDKNQNTSWKRALSSRSTGWNLIDEGTFLKRDDMVDIVWSICPSDYAMVPHRSCLLSVTNYHAPLEVGKTYTCSVASVDESAGEVLLLVRCGYNNYEGKLTQWMGADAKQTSPSSKTSIDAMMPVYMMEMMEYQKLSKSDMLVITDNTDLQSGAIYCVRCDPQSMEKMDALNEQIAAYCNETSKPYKPVSKEVCIAKFEDGSWYRALVAGIAGDIVHVMFLDFGNGSSCHFSNIRRMPPNFMEEMPAQACFCHFKDFSKNPTKYTDHADDLFNTSSFLKLDSLEFIKNGEYRITLSSSVFDQK